ncbi:ATP-dependent RNA helicase DDX24 [Ixodes scapularis]|uniref:ATP-dependent RNA helicase DDX24 n=1 Tax=Ixodes scapularis TaxID=6945 RepID=UPI001A9F0252|nr:ATP-dependent RNA helicase DDX24 [Ixodes scapularis]
MKQKSVVIRAKSDWKAVDVDSSTFDGPEWEGFSGLEELSSYDIVRQGEPQASAKRAGGAEQTVTKKKKKRKADKQKRSEPKTAADHQSNDEIPVQEQDEKDMSAWLNCYVPEPVLKALAELNFTQPTPIQAQTLPSAIRDHMDVMGAAETGSGKTLAFGIPILHHIAEQKARIGDGPMSLQALVLTPTRELAIQVKQHLQSAAKYTGIGVVNVIGGLSADKQLRLLKRRPEIVVATPGRLWELVDQNTPHLSDVSNVRYLVIDEADRMVEKGHFEDLTRLLALMNADRVDGAKRRQNFVFSATLTMVHDLPQRLKHKARKRKLSEKDKLEQLMRIIGVSAKPKVVDLTRKLGTAESLRESRIVCSSIEDKDSRLYYFLLAHPGRTLVFCNSIDSVRRLVSVLDLLQCSPLPLHAQMQQRQRLKNLDRFRSSPTGLLLATDVAARGLDIEGIEHVIHFQVPRTAEVYVHRSGRTARAASDGLSVMLMEPRELPVYRKICRTLGREEDLPDFPVDSDVLKAVLDRVSLARRFEAESHKVKRQTYENSWLQRAAREMDIDLDKRMLADTDEKKTADQKRRLRAMQAQLTQALRRPIFPAGFSGRYLTKQGELLLPKLSEERKALKAIDKKGLLKKRRIARLPLDKAVSKPLSLARPKVKGKLGSKKKKDRSVRKNKK